MWNEDAERAVLGAILLDDTVWTQASEKLQCEDFSLDAHRLIFRRMGDLANSARSIDQITLMDELARHSELEMVGGTAYVLSLTDGTIRTKNISHHAQIVKDKSMLRGFAKFGELLVSAAQAPDIKSEELHARVREFLMSERLRASGRGLRSVTADELLVIDVPTRTMVLEPAIPTQGLGMLYSKRGVGKTYLALGMAWAVATGGQFLCWAAPKSRHVLYVDGELPAATLKNRVDATMRGMGTHASEGSGKLRFITPDLQSGPLPDLASRAGQGLVENQLDGAELLVLDNLSALCRSGKENEGESWLPMQDWALSLRQSGISVLFVHHAGKSGTQRGTSRREDLLDVVIALRHPSDYSASEGLRCEVHYEKARAFYGEEAKPFEVCMQMKPDGSAIWRVRDIEDSLFDRAAEMYRDGMSVRDVADELKISKSKAHRLRSRRGYGEMRPGDGKL